MGYSLVPSVLRTYVSLLQASTDLADVQVSYGNPGDVLNDEAVWVEEDVQDWTQEWKAMGPPTPRIEETFGLPVKMIAWKPGQGPHEALVRAFELYEACQAIVRDQSNFMALRADPVSTLLTVQLTPNTSDPWMSREGRKIGISALLRVKARI